MRANPNTEKSIPLDRAQAQFEELCQRRDELVERRAAIDAEILTLMAKIDLLAELMEAATIVSVNGKSLRDGTVTRAVLEYVDKNPGAQKRHIANQVAKTIKSTAGNPERSIFNLIGNLLRTGRLTECDHGGIFLCGEMAVQMSELSKQNGNGNGRPLLGEG